jgi:hypothetical protein
VELSELANEWTWVFAEGVPWRNTIKSDRREKGGKEKTEYSGCSPESAAGIRAIQVAQESRNTKKQGYGFGRFMRFCTLEDEMNNLQCAQEISEALSRWLSV